MLDGYKRFDFCNNEGIDYRVQEMNFSFREEAIIWLCKKRLRKVDVVTPIGRYLVGKWYISQKTHNRELKKRCSRQMLEFEYSKGKHNSKWDTSSYLGQVIGLNRTTVERYGRFVIAMDKIYNKEQALFHAIMRENVNLGLDRISDVSDMDKKKMSELYDSLIKEENSLIARRRQGRRNKRKRNDENETRIVTGIKEMPVFDPDMEIRGLTLTIPTWISAISKAEKKINVNIATDTAKKMLIFNLNNLQEQISKMLEVLECTKTEY